MNQKKIFLKQAVDRRQLMKTGLGFIGMTTLFPLLSACSNKGPSYYSLSSFSGKIYGASPRVVEVRTPSLAGSLDKDRIVSEINRNQVNLEANATWSDNLSFMISRVTALNLAQRLPRSHVFAQNQATSLQADAFVEMDISRFNQDISGKAVATISLVIYRAGEEKSGITKLLQLEKTPHGNSLGDIVAALDLILADVSDVVAQSLSILSQKGSN